jgi:hypothetical protein
MNKYKWNIRHLYGIHSDPVNMDVVIVYHSKDAKILPHCLEGLKYVKELRNIYCISNEPCQYYVPETLAPFSLEYVKAYVGNVHPGWYLQQILKLYAGHMIPELSETYLVLDSDTVFVKDISFLNEKGIPKYATGIEYHAPYFEHIQRILPELKKQIIQSGICHHMVFQQTYIRELMDKVENIHGIPFWKCMLQNVDPLHHAWSGMSEYELYFNYMLKYRPDQIELRNLRWMNVQEIPYYQTKNIDELIDYTKQHADFVSIHSWYY